MHVHITKLDDKVVLAASPLELSFSARSSYVNRRPSQLLLLQADTRHLIPVTTPCSQPLCAGLHR